MLLVGPPGSGKTMPARRIASILPPLSLGEVSLAHPCSIFLDELPEFKREVLEVLI